MDVPMMLPASVDHDANKFQSVSFRVRDQLLITGERGGPRDEMQVVLLSGLGRTRRSWSEVARVLVTAGYGVTSLDLRGHGGSGWPRSGDYSLRAFADDLHAVLLQLHVKPVVVGASVGGWAALIAAAERPRGEIAGVALVDALPAVSADGYSSFERFMAECERGFDGMHEACNKAANFFGAAVALDAPEDVRTSLRRGSDGRLYWHWDPESIRRRVQGGRFDIDSQVLAAGRVAAPILLLTGASGDRVDPGSVDAFRAAAPHTQWVEVSATIGNAPRPAMQLAALPLLRFMQQHWPVDR